MNDETTLAEIKHAVRTFNEARDWGQYHSPRNVAMALTVEASELLELYLWCADDGPQPRVEGRQEQVADELADVLILLANLADRTGIDLGEAVEQKLKKNAVKYPVEQARGRMEKYDELDG